MATRKTEKPDPPKEREPFTLRNQFAKFQRQAAPPNYTIAAYKVCHSAGRVMREKYLEMMLEMEEFYPGRGWRQQMNELEKFYHDRGLALKEYPVVKCDILVKGIERLVDDMVERSARLYRAEDDDGRE